LRNDDGKEGGERLTGKKLILSALCLLICLPGCGIWKSTVNNVKKDIPLEEMDKLNDKYVGKRAWTRALIVDLGHNGIIDRGVEVEIVELDVHWNGAIGVRGPNKRKYRHGLGLDRPITPESFEMALDKLFWYDKPDKRYRMNLRTFGKATARAIRDNELFKGMKSEAALESWGYPDEMLSHEIGGDITEQWIYMDPRQRTKKRYIWLRNGAVEKWEE
jgi:hypothetical protein